MSAMHDLIPVINKVQDILSTIGNSPLDLPQIAVVGSQSSGKSSVLEALSARTFCQRGRASSPAARSSSSSNTPCRPRARRRPAAEWAEFLHAPGQIFTDFEDGISSEPIHLKIHSPNVVDLTLPGDIELQIRELIMGYITRPNCVILAVSPANVDLANSDSLKLAREVDPSGNRTLGLLTKLDLMDSGASAADILSGRVYPAAPWICRCGQSSQRDIELRRSLEYARKREAQYFAAHPVYAGLPGKVGTANLARTLNMVLMAHIRERLPDLKIKLNALIQAKQAELATYGEGPGDLQGQSPQSLVLRLITKYAADFNASVEGTNSTSATTELSGGARLFHIFDQVFGHALETMDPVAALSVREIRTAMRNATGSRPALFIPEAAFDLLVKPQIARLESPSLRCVEPRVLDGVAELLKEHLLPTRTFVTTLVAIQRAYINTSHPDFIGGANAVAQLEKNGSAASGHGHGAGNASVGTAGIEASLSSMALRSSSSSAPGAPRATTPSSSSASAAALAASHQREGLLTYLFGSAQRPPSVYGPGLAASGSLAAAAAAAAASAAVTSPSLSATTGSITTPGALALDDDHAAGGHEAAGSVDASTGSGGGQTREREEFAIALIRSLISSYFGIVKKALADAVPKAVMHLLVNQTKEALQNRLVQQLYRDDVFEELLQEDPEVTKARSECREMLETYQKALEVIAQAY
ncbi:Dynamin central region-domain-containing protein [Catenaria anguillulae PL171]|uniref:Dynamin central region-domain-containing protein n=1 Tax=Catenaria anguillulae PL171 TaxID=765915 RepID=A0A1Y2HR85_9FUNG|nr:Dynamin central region-domain-containing protein [Catenaria anguillulae PL171]